MAGRPPLPSHLISMAGLFNASYRTAIAMHDSGKPSFAIPFLLEASDLTLCRPVGGARATDAEGEQCKYGGAARI
jgi:hypothetical protein